MITEIKGLHHMTAMARDAAENNAFWTRTMGLRRVKQTVNFDEPSVYHLYYGDELGTPGTIMTYFPFPRITRGRPGTGEVGTTVFSVPPGALAFWENRLTAAGAGDVARATSFGENRLTFRGPDGDGLALVEVGDDSREPWAEGGVDGDVAIRGFHSGVLRLKEAGATAELLRFMGYEEAGRDGNVLRLVRPGGNDARTIDIAVHPDMPSADLGAGSVHHIAFAVGDRDAQIKVQAAIADAGYQITPVIDRDYFYSVYFRTPGGVLFEIATNEPGFARDEEPAHLGEALQLPAQHAHLRARLEQHLQPLEA